MNALVVSAAEAATMLKLSKSQILAELEAGSIEAYRDGRNWKIPIVKLEQYVVRRAEEEASERRQL